MIFTKDIRNIIDVIIPWIVTFTKGIIVLKVIMFLSIYEKNEKQKM